MSNKERWGTRIGLVLAMAGNAVGLGNFLRFPAQAAQNGGGTFLIPYLISFLLMGIPLLWVEWAIGRHGGIYGHHSAPGMLDRLGKRPWLKYLGVFGIFTNLTVAAYYCYVESWALAYVFHSIKGTFANTAGVAFFNEYVGAVPGRSLFAAPPFQAVFFFAVTLTLNTWILSRGLVKGIEVVAKIGMPLLLFFGAFLAVRGLLLGPGDPGVIQSPWEGLNFVWNPDFGGLTNPTTWLAAAGQIFFTLSVGMGSVHCYASYVRKKQDIALNAASAGWLNEWVEVVLGGTLLIPIATAYLGLEVVQSQTAGGSGFGLAFQSMPELFRNWGWFASLAGAMWFGLLFVSGITSSLAMGQPVMSFFEDEYGVSRKRAALGFGLATFLLGGVTVWLFSGGAFGEFDFWTGTFSLVVFALGESFIFAYIFGMDKGWAEITRGADIKVPTIFRYVIQYVTPLFILIIFVTSVIKPAGGDWAAAFSALTSSGSWPLDPSSVIGKILHVGEDYVWFKDGNATPALVQDVTRALLSLVFVGCGFLIWKAWRGRERRDA